MSSAASDAVAFPSPSGERSSGNSSVAKRQLNKVQSALTKAGLVRSKLVQSVLPLLERYQVSAYMNGHDHCIQHIKPPGSVVDYHTIGSAAINRRNRIVEFDPAGDHGGKVSLRRDPELDIDIGEAKVTIHQQGPFPGLGEG